MCGITTASSKSEPLTDPQQVSSALGEAFAVWSRQWDGDQLPVWSAVRFAEYPATLIPWAVVGEFEEKENDFRVRFWGSSRTNFFKADETGALLSQLRMASLRQKIRHEYGEVRERGHPVIFRSQIESEEHGSYTYCKIRLPLRRAGGNTADVILSLDDPALITRQMYLAWEVEPPLDVK